MGGLKAQSPEIYTDLYMEPMKYQQFKNFIGYELENYFLYVGDGKESLYLYILDRNSGEKIYTLDERDIKARRHAIRFFGLADDQSTTVVTVSLEGDYSYGSHILIVENNKVYNAGFIQYGVDNFNFASIGLYAQFEKHEDGFLMFFREDARIINYATEELIPGSEIEFLVTKQKITRTK